MPHSRWEKYSEPSEHKPPHQQSSRFENADDNYVVKGKADTSEDITTKSSSAQLKRPFPSGDLSINQEARKIKQLVMRDSRQLRSFAEIDLPAVDAVTRNIGDHKFGSDNVHYRLGAVPPSDEDFNIDL